MATIECTIDGETYSVEVAPPRGDLNRLYRQGDALVDELRSAGYELTGSAPAFQELASAHQRADEADVIDLGDLSERVTERDPEGSDGAPLPGDAGAGTTDPPSPSDGEGDVALTLVGPDDQQVTRSYGANEGMGSVTADLQDHYGVDRDEQVCLYASAERRHEVPTEAPVSEYDGKTLYWGTESLL
jgi:hypothetical protein